MRTNQDAVCLNCGNEFKRWNGRPNSKFCCRRCSILYRYKQDKDLGKKLTEKAHQSIKSGVESPNWKGGKHLRRGYVIQTYAPNKRKEEHILIAEKMMGRKLRKNEVVHHINGITSDNRNINLLVMTRGQHTSLHNAMKFKKAA